MAAIISHGSPADRLPWTTAPRRCAGAATHVRPSAAVYRRRQLAAAAVVAAAVTAAGLGLSALGGGSLTTSGVGSAPAGDIEIETGSLRTVATVTHVVAPGDTLWSIARSLQPEGDVRPLVDEMAASRGGRPLQVGERIRLP